jgi:hypothetical protein
MGSKNLFAGMCAVGLMLAIPTPVSSQPSHLSLGLVQFGAAAVEEVRHRRSRQVHRTIERINVPPIPTMVGPTIIAPTTTIRAGAEASMQLNNCCNASLANHSCLAGEQLLLSMIILRC